MQASSVNPRQHKPEWSIAFDCHDCGALVQYYLGSRTRFPILTEAGHPGIIRHRCPKRLAIMQRRELAETGSIWDDLPPLEQRPAHFKWTPPPATKAEMERFTAAAINKMKEKPLGWQSKGSPSRTAINLPSLPDV